MLSVYNCGLLEHFNSYVCKIASFHNYQTKFASSQKFPFSRNENIAGNLSLLYVGPKCLSEIPEDLRFPSSF